MEFKCVFPDNAEPRTTRAGFNTTEDYKKNTFQNFFHGPDAVEGTMISRPNSKFLQDYDKDNFSKAFLLQFPYGYGCEIIERNSIGKQKNSKTKNKNASSETKNYRSGKKFMQFLLRLSNPYFHMADFACVAYSLFYRHKMVENVFFKTSQTEHISFLSCCLSTRSVINFSLRDSRSTHVGLLGLLILNHRGCWLNYM